MLADRIESTGLKLTPAPEVHEPLNTNDNGHSLDSTEREISAMHTFASLLGPIFEAWGLWFSLVPLFIVLTIVFTIVLVGADIVRNRKSK